MPPHFARNMNIRIKTIDFEVSPPRRKQADETPPQTDDDFDFDEDGEGWGEESGSVIARTISIINIRKTTSKDGALEVNKLMDPLPEAEALPALKKEVLADQFMVGQVVGKAGQHAVLTVYPVDMYDGDVMKVTDNILAIMERFEAPDFKIMVTGTPALGAQINKMVISDLMVLGSTALIAVILTLIWLFRSWIGVVGPVVVIIFSVIWTFGFMATAGLTVNILSGILPAFLFL